MNKRQTILAVLTLMLVMCTVTGIAVQYFTISNISTTGKVNAKRTPLIDTFTLQFPDSIDFGTTYQFVSYYENVVVQALSSLTTMMKIQYFDISNNTVVLLPSDFIITVANDYYSGPIQDMFVWDAGEEALLLSGINGTEWALDVGVQKFDIINFSIDILVALPDGTLAWDIWVIAPRGT